MKVGCNIKKIEIENFRGIKSLDFEFHPSQPTVVIGPNNVGKTTFLDALGLALASGKFLRFELTDDDFWKDDTGNHADEFTIKLTLEATADCILPAVKGGVGDPIDVHAIIVRGNREACTVQRVLLPVFVS
jgi:predicted ATP-dependent endonuclease of OLD family